jgi:alkanesulfonate monooxygenase SsuD/methylene tetrahydromethanopterin reductase-like flavin-dependent oxidoreductase (luciferase family)
MLGLNVVAADSDHEARRLFTSHQQLLLRLGRGQLGPLPPPVDPDRFQTELTPIERADLQRTHHPPWWDHRRRFERASLTLSGARPQTS